MKMKNSFKGGTFPSGMDTGTNRVFQNPGSRRGFGLPVFKKGKSVGEVTEIPNTPRYNPKKP